MRRDLKNFVFSGVLARHATRDMQARGVLRSRAVSAEERREQDLLASVEESIRGGALAMQQAYRILYVLENLVRSIIVERLKDKSGDSWFDTHATAPMKSKFRDRQAKELQHQWHSGRNREPIFYMDFGDLSKLIVNNWPEFEDLLPSQPWVQSRLEEAERSRNVIAHTNLLASEEIGRLEMYLTDWIKQAG